MAAVLVIVVGPLQAATVPVALKVIDDAIVHCLPRPVFGGGPVKVLIAVNAPLGTQLQLERDLVQIAGTLAAPLGASQQFGPPLHFVDRTHQIIEAPIEIPKVNRVANFVVRIRTAEVAAECVIRFTVYPPDILKPLFDELHAPGDRGGRLTVFGKSRRLRAFLEKNAIPFDEGGDTLTQTPKPGRAYLCEESDSWLTSTRPELTRGSVVVFVEDSSELPGVYVSPLPEGRLAKVTLPILDDLSINPQSQMAFTRITAQALKFSVSQNP